MKNTNRLIGGLLIALLLLPSCGGPAKRQGDHDRGLISTLENAWGCIELTMNVAVLEYLLNLDDLPISDDSLDNKSNDYLMFEEYYERKKQFNSLNIEIDSVHIEFRAEKQFVGSSLIDSISVLVGKLSIHRRNVIFSGNIDFQFELPSSIKGSGQIAVNSDSLNIGLSPFETSFEKENYDTIEFTARASYRQLEALSMLADNAALSAYCSINFTANAVDVRKVKKDLLVLNFEKDDKFWLLNSSAKSLVELLDNLDN